MKKTVFIAALAIVAMASCTKNELKVPSTGSDAVISFQPVVANATKADYITNSTIAPTGDPKSSTFKFTVYAWYTDGAEMTTSTTTATAKAYMSGVEVSYKPGHNDATQGEGGWSPATTYYWPKNGYLSFDAYAPSTASADGTFSSVVETGLQIANYTVKGIDDQYDLLYSTRTLNKTKSTDGTNTTYDGVDIAFKHALAAIEVTAKTDKNYSGAIKLKKITILNAYNKGNFTQGMNNAAAEGAAAWSGQSTETPYELFKNDSGVELTQTALTSTTLNPIRNAILLPQEFSHSGGNKVSIRVDYTIKHGTAELPQYYVVDLSSTSGHVGSDPSASLSAWEIGKRYTYNFIFSLDEVYFAPEVAEWTNVTVDGIDVK